jgi:serine/threonine-protein kinase HipA
MQLALGRFDISRDAMLADALRFGFESRDECGRYLDNLLVRINASFDEAVECLDEAWRRTMHERLTHNLSVLRGEGAANSGVRT